MKKKISATSASTSKDKEDWVNFTKEMGKINVKEMDFLGENKEIKKFKKLDLHGSSLEEANQKVKNFLIKSFKDGYKKLLIVTGKGSRSKSYDNPYVSDKLSILKYSIPEFINNEESLRSKIIKISQAEIKDGGDGAFYVFLKSNKKVTE